MPVICARCPFTPGATESETSSRVSTESESRGSCGPDAPGCIWGPVSTAPQCSTGAPLGGDDLSLCLSGVTGAAHGSLVRDKSMCLMASPVCLASVSPGSWVRCTLEPPSCFHVDPGRQSCSPKGLAKSREGLGPMPLVSPSFALPGANTSAQKQLP